MESSKQTFDTGLGIRREMFGRAGADDRVLGATDFNRPLEDLVTRYCFGEIWSRPELHHKVRSMLTLAILTALGKPNQLKAHVQGAIRNGVTPDEIREVLLHTAIYAGIPAGVEGFRAATEALAQAHED